MGFSGMHVADDVVVVVVVVVAVVVVAAAVVVVAVVFQRRLLIMIISHTSPWDSLLHRRRRATLALNRYASATKMVAASAANGLRIYNVVMGEYKENRRVRVTLSLSRKHNNIQ